MDESNNNLKFNSIINKQDDCIENSNWNITIEDLSSKDLNSLSETDDVVFFRSSSSCSCTC